MDVFLVIGGVGVALVVISVLFGDILDGVLEFAPFELSDGLLSMPVIGAFLAAFGFGGALLMQGPQFSPLWAGAGGVAAGAAVGGATLWLVRGLMNMPTDPTPRTGDLVGTIGTVVTRIPPNGLGEISVTTSGQRLKLNARADGPVAAGTTVVVVDVTSPTSVIVTESGF
ncbi:MAG: hypothetical protein GEU74_09640 [Nitriliruptorales bacterium]|nr:hypothetical protein [Nitriliruptorales bacterium]